MEGIQSEIYYYGMGGLQVVAFPLLVFELYHMIQSSQSSQPRLMPFLPTYLVAQLLIMGFHIFEIIQDYATFLQFMNLLNDMLLVSYHDQAWNKVKLLTRKFYLFYLINILLSICDDHRTQIRHQYILIPLYVVLILIQYWYNSQQSRGVLFSQVRLPLLTQSINESPFDLQVKPSVRYIDGQLSFKIKVRCVDQTFTVFRTLNELIALEKRLHFYDDYGDSLFETEGNELQQVEKFVKKIKKENFFNDVEVFETFGISQAYYKEYCMQQDEKSEISQSTIFLRQGQINYWPYFCVQITHFGSQAHQSDSPFKNSTYYQIQFFQMREQHKVYKIEKRYSHFCLLDENLRQIFQTNLLPSLPPKNIFQSNPSQRRQLLQDYLQILLNSPMFFVDAVFKFFDLQIKLPLTPLPMPMEHFTASFIKFQKVIESYVRPYTSYIFLIKSSEYCFEISKRYNNFYELYRVLEKQIEIPKIPSKRVRKDRKLQERKESLTKWLNDMFQIPRIEDYFIFRKFIFEHLEHHKTRSSLQKTSLVQHEKPDLDIEYLDRTNSIDSQKLQDPPLTNRSNHIQIL